MNDETKEGFVKLKMPTYYIAKYSYEDLQAAVLAEREKVYNILISGDFDGSVKASIRKILEQSAKD